MTIETMRGEGEEREGDKGVLLERQMRGIIMI